MWNSRMAEYTREMVPAYLECAAWSSNYTAEDGTVYEDLTEFEFSREAKDEAWIICANFVIQAWPYLDDFTARECGHSFWFSHNGHGAGFFDYECGQDTRRHARILQEKSKNFPEKNIYIDNELLKFDI